MTEERESLVCPECGSDDLYTLEVASARAAVILRRGDDDAISHTDVEWPEGEISSLEPDWETDGYGCQSCGAMQDDADYFITRYEFELETQTKEHAHMEEERQK